MPVPVCEGDDVTGGDGVGEGVPVPVGAGHLLGPNDHRDARHTKFWGPLSEPDWHSDRSVQ